MAPLNAYPVTEASNRDSELVGRKARIVSWWTSGTSLMLRWPLAFGLLLLLSAENANAQARWLTQKTKPFTNGKTLPDVLEELAEAHGFKVEYENETLSESLKDDTGGLELVANLDGVPLETTLTLLCSKAGALQPWPWKADKATLTIHDPSAMVNVTHNIRGFGQLLSDPEELKDAIMFSVNADWADFEEPDKAAKCGTISDITAASITVRQDYRGQLEVSELLQELQAAASGKSTPVSSAADKKIDRILDKPFSLPAGEIPLQDLFAKALTPNKIPWIVMAEDLDVAKVNLTDAVILDGKKQPLRETLTAVLEPLKLSIKVQDGIVEISSSEEFDDRRIYNVQKLLNQTTAAEIAAKIESMDGVTVDYSKPLGPLVIVGTDPASHDKITAALSGK